MTTETATKNRRVPRATLAGQIDRLDGILDGLAEALNESVADAVRKTVGEEVREVVEQAVREVLADPELMRAALARHAPVATPAPGQPPRRTLREALAGTVAWLAALAAPPAGRAGEALGWAWAWCLRGLRRATEAVSEAAALAAGVAAEGWHVLASLAGVAWRLRRQCGAALGVGVGAGLLAYAAGPVAASLLCGVAGAALTLGGALLVPLCRLLCGPR